MFIQNSTCRIKIGLAKPVSAAPQPVLACPILIVFILFPLKCNEYCIVFREISLTPFSILIPHTSAYSDRLNANQLRHYETCNNCNICLKVTTLTWQFHFFRPATNEWTSAILRVLIKMYLNNQSITQISGKSKTIWTSIRNGSCYIYPIGCPVQHINAKSSTNTESRWAHSRGSDYHSLLQHGWYQHGAGGRSPAS